MATKAKFKKGDRVKISKSSEYYSGDKTSLSSNPRDVVGTVTSCKEPSYEDDFTTQVDWDNGTNNAYRDYDLELVADKANNNALTVDKEFIKEAYAAACSDWKSKIKDKFPEAFETDMFNFFNNKDKKSFSMTADNNESSIEPIRYVADGIAPNGEGGMWLAVNPEWELVQTESGGLQLFGFKRKKS